MPEPLRALRQALSPACARSLTVALVLGKALNLVNQDDLWVVGSALSHRRMALTNLMPCCVATYGGWSIALAAAQPELCARPAAKAREGIKQSDEAEP